MNVLSAFQVATTRPRSSIWIDCYFLAQPEMAPWRRCLVAQALHDFGIHKIQSAGFARSE